MTSAETCVEAVDYRLESLRARWPLFSVRTEFARSQDVSPGTARRLWVVVTTPDGQRVYAFTYQQTPWHLATIRSVDLYHKQLSLSHGKARKRSRSSITWPKRRSKQDGGETPTYHA